MFLACQCGAFVLWFGAFCWGGMDQCESKVSKCRSKFISSALILFLCFALTFILLIYQTAREVSDENWQKAGRAYDTKSEYESSYLISEIEGALLKSEWFTFDSWPIQYLDMLNRSKYKSAIAKIPADDFERSYWYFKVYFLPRTYGDQQEVAKYAKEIMPTLVEQLKMAPTSVRASKIVSALHYHLVVEYYSDYIRVLGPKIDEPFYQDNYNYILEAVYDNARTLDPILLREYSNGSMRRLPFSVLESAYAYLGSNVFKNKVCNLKIAKQWLEISDKSYEVLIKNPDAASDYITSPEVRTEYQQFYEQYQKKDKILRKQIDEHC